MLGTEVGTQELSSPDGYQPRDFPRQKVPAKWVLRKPPHSLQLCVPDLPDIILTWEKLGQQPVVRPHPRRVRKPSSDLSGCRWAWDLFAFLL